MTLNGHRADRETLRRIIHHVRGFADSPHASTAFTLMFLLVLLLMTVNGLNVINSYVGRDFITAIENRHHADFIHKAWLYVAVFAASTVVLVLYRYCEERLALLWRSWMSRQLIERYLSKRAYFHMEQSGQLPNPDQRIAEDTRSFTTTTLSFALMTLNASFTVIAFSGVLWSISPRLFVVAVIYATAGSLITVWVGHRLIGLNDRQLDYEADFRNELIQLRENTEAIAVLHGEPSVRERLLERLDRALGNTRRMINVNRNLGFFTNGYNYLIQIIPALLVAPLFIDGDVEFGVITQSAMAFSTLMGAFSLAVTQFSSISSYAAVTARLAKLIDTIEHAAEPAQTALRLQEDNDHLQYRALDLRMPDGRVLVRKLDISIEYGLRTLVASPSGHAKLALFKSTAGLHVDGSGDIIRPKAGTMLFVPDQPYLRKGKLRDLMTYGTEQRVRDDDILSTLQLLKLDGLIKDFADGLDTERDWGHSCGLSERARLVLARVLLARPRFVFLDRLSTALEPSVADKTLELLSRQGITYIVLGRPSDPTRLFDARLSIERDGSWRWERFDHSFNDAENLRDSG